MKAKLGAKIELECIPFQDLLRQQGQPFLER
jgi:hypothetical protein